MVYILVFAVSLICCYFSEKKFKASKKTMGVLLATLAIMLPTILAGLRTIDVGTDVKLYLVDDYQAALRAGDFIEYTEIAYGEPLFLSLVYAISTVFSDVNVLMFFLSLVTVAVFYLGCVKFRDKAPVYLIFGFFLFIYFNMSLNMIRQSIALSFSFLAFYYLFKKKWPGFFILGLVAFLFHSSAIILLAVFALYLLFSKIKNKRTLYTISGIAVAFFAMIFDVVMKNLVGSGFLGERYLYYAQSNNADPSFGYIGISVFVLIGAILARKDVIKSQDGRFLLFTSFLNAMLLGLSLRFNNTERLTYYFGYFNILLAPMIVTVTTKTVQENKEMIKRRKSGTVLLILCLYFGILCSYHLIYYNLLGNHQTYPYNSYILGDIFKGNDIE